MRPELSVIVPAYQEADRIQANIRHLLEEVDKLGRSYEVIVVSDGDTGRTVDEVHRIEDRRVSVLSYPVNMGKGFALLHGFRHAHGALIGFIDADMELHPRSLAAFVRVLEKGSYDIVVGSKRHPESEVVYPAFRRLQSWVYQVLIRVLFNLSVRDTQTGLKLMRREVLEAVAPLLLVKRFAFDLELLVVAAHLGFRRIGEAPIELNYRFQSTTDYGAVYRVLVDTAAIFYRLRILRYYDRMRQPTSRLTEVE